MFTFLETYEEKLLELKRTTLDLDKDAKTQTAELQKVCSKKGSQTITYGHWPFSMHFSKTADVLLCSRMYGTLESPNLSTTHSFDALIIQ